MLETDPFAAAVAFSEIGPLLGKDVCMEIYLEHEIDSTEDPPLAQPPPVPQVSRTDEGVVELCKNRLKEAENGDSRANGAFEGISQMLLARYTFRLEDR